MSLKDIANTWDACARTVICEYAQQFGGGTFSSKYGTWEKFVAAFWIWYVSLIMSWLYLYDSQFVMSMVQELFSTAMRTNPLLVVLLGVVVSEGVEGVVVYIKESD